MYSAYKLVNRLVHTGRLKPSSLGQLAERRVYRTTPVGMKSKDTVESAYAKGYKHGLKGKGGWSQATYKEQEKVDAYMRGNVEGRAVRSAQAAQAGQQ